MEIDSPTPDTTPFSPCDQILKRLALLGVPEEHWRRLYSGLVEFVRVNPSRIPEVVSAILSTDEEVAEALQEAREQPRNSLGSWNMKRRFCESMVWLQWLMFEDEPAVGLKKLAKTNVGQRGVCGVVWGNNDIAYKCRTCENDPTCAICVPCFQNGNHKDHDYSIIYTSGGCCDCGDETAWKREGFCSKHKGAEQIQPLPESIAKSVGPVLDALFIFWKNMLLSAENVSRKDFSPSDNVTESEEKTNELTFVVVEMLLEFCKYSESLLSFVSRKIISSVDLLNFIVKAERYLSQDVVKVLHELLLKLLGEPVFKSEFARVFLSYYPVVINEAIEQYSDDVLDKYPLLSKFSVQIFTVPTLTLHLTEEMNLLAVLLGCLGDIFASCAGEDGRLEGTKWQRLNFTTTRVISDIKLAMSHVTVSKYATHEQRDLSRTWLRLLTFVQGMNPLKRETGIHIEEENDSMHYFFFLAHYMAPIHSLLVDGAYTATGNKGTWDECTSTGEQDMDDQDVERHAKVGRLSREGSACSAAGSNTTFAGILKDAEVNSDVSCHALLSSSAIWLIHECLRVLEKCLGDDEGISRALHKFSSPNARSICGSNLLSLKRTLSKIEKGKYIFSRLGSFSGEPSTDFSLLSGETQMSVNMENVGEIDGRTWVSISNETDLVSGRSAVLNGSVSGGNCAVDSDSLRFLCLSHWPDVCYDVSSQDISVHMPLHRLLSWLLLKALRKCYGESPLPSMVTTSFANPCYTDFFRYVLGDCHPYGFSAFIMEHALRIRVFCAEVNAGMWRRSGDAALVSCEWYRSVRWFEQGLELDLFLLQCCGALAPANSYVNRILDRFGLSSYLSLSLERSNEYEPALVQEMLTLIIQILQERRFSGLAMAESVKREMIYKLATGDATHSQLVKSLPRDLSQFDNLQEILDNVAVYSNPSGFNQGKYSLRPCYWKELDLYHPRWNSRELQVADERYSRYFGMSALTAQLPKWTKIYPPLMGLAKVATCEATLRILSAVLYYAFYNDKSVESRAPDGVLITALHLLSLSLDICRQQKEFSNNECNAEDSIPLLSLAGQEIGGISQGTGKQSLLSLLVSLMRTRKEDNFYRFGEAGHCDLSSWIRSLLRKFAEIDSACVNKLQNLAPEVVSHLSGLDITVSGFVSDTEKRKAKARERQAAILAKMKAEQSKFLSIVSTGMDIDGSKAEIDQRAEHDAEAAIHEVCCLCHDPKSKEPVSFLIFLQKSKLLSFMDRGSPSWEQDRRTEKEKLSSVFDRHPDLLEMNISSESSRVISPRPLKLMEDTIGESAHHRHGERSYLVEFVKARLMRNNAEHMLETLEQDMYLNIRKKYDELKFKSVTLKEDKHPDAESGPNSILDSGQSILLDKYFGILSKEFYRSPSASANFRKDKLLTAVASQTGYDGFRPTDCDGIHLSSCGHAMHQGCLERYLSSLKERSARSNVFEGAHIVKPDKGEFLCPVCRRLANSVLPASPRDPHSRLQLPINSNVASAIFSSPDRSNEQILSLQLTEALCLLQSAADVIGKSDILKALPLQRDERRRCDLEFVSRTLSKMYFSKSWDNVQEISLLSQSVIMWDVLKYSLMSMEIAARCGKTSMLPIFSVDSLYGEFKTSSGSILSLLLRVVQSTRTKNVLHVLQRFVGMQLFAESICSATSVSFPSSIHGREGTMLGLRKNFHAAASGADILFWNRASDPILASDPFTSLMWVLFCLPSSFISCKESLLSLVHIFYSVSLVQAIITYCAKHPRALNGLGIQESLFTDISKALGGSGCVQQYFVSNHVDSSCDIKGTLRKFSFPYLRRCALLWRLLNSTPATFREKDYTLDAPSGSTSDMMDFKDGGQSELSELQKLEKIFDIPPIDTVLSDEFLRSLSIKWFRHFQREYEVNRLQGCLFVTPTVPFRLMNLPNVYQDLLQRCFKQSCPDCKEVIKEPVLCLLCGRLCSPSWKPCCRLSGCQTHATSCGAGTGVFLLIRRTTILLQRCARQASWPSPYLDAFGEEDLDMQRGKPLYLNEERYAALTYMVASHGLDRSSKVLAHTTIGSS